jgi:putative nucleotidyltransferase with HDIG domain
VLTPFRAATPPAVAELREELHRLPVHNTTALRILARLEDPDLLVTELSGLIQGDPALTTRMLRLANSSFFGLRSEVADIDRAIMAVGFSTVRTFTLAAAFDLFTDRGANLPADFWHHALAVAAGTTVIARKVRLSPGDAFSAGLLHDLGEALLFRHAPDRFEATRLAVNDDIEQRLAVERTEFGVDHAEAAAVVLRDSRFPKALVEAIADHHQPPRKRWAGKPDLRAVVAVGETLGECLPADASLVPADDVVTPAVEALGLDAATVPGLYDELVAAYADSTAFMGG